MPHLGFEADRQGFFGELLHGGTSFLCWREGHESRHGRAKTGAKALFSASGDLAAAVPAATAARRGRPLKTCNFNTPLYCRDSRRSGPLVADRAFLCQPQKPLCYIRLGPQKRFGASAS